MASILHGSARTTPRVRAELQASKEAASVLAKRYGLSRTTVNKWRSRSGDSRRANGTAGLSQHRSDADRGRHDRRLSSADAPAAR